MKNKEEEIREGLKSVHKELTVDARFWDIKMYNSGEEEATEEDYRIVTCIRQDDAYKIPVSSFYKPISNWFNLLND